MISHAESRSASWYFMVCFHCSIAIPVCGFIISFSFRVTRLRLALICFQNIGPTSSRANQACNGKKFIFLTDYYVFNPKKIPTFVITRCSYYFWMLLHQIFSAFVIINHITGQLTTNT